MHDGTKQILKHFTYGHLPVGAPRNVSEEFSVLAHKLVESKESGGYGLEGPEATAGLRKLLEGKDCFVRSTNPASYRKDTLVEEE